MKVRNVLMLVLALIAGSSMLFAGGKGEAAATAPAGDVKPVVLRLAETHPADYPTNMGNLRFAELVKERSNGRIIIEVYSGSQLGQERAVIEQVQFGAIDFTRVSVSPLAAFVPVFNALQLPYLYRSEEIGRAHV